MTREEAYEFIKLYRKFRAETEGVDVAGLVSDEEIELQVGMTFRAYDDWYAAKVIEANAK